MDCTAKDAMDQDITDLEFTTPTSSFVGEGELDGMDAFAIYFDLSFPKGAERDESLFGNWEMEINTSANNPILGTGASSKEKFVLSAPVFKNKVATEEDYWPIPLGYESKFIDDVTTIDPTAKSTDYGQQTVDITLFETGLAYGDDAVRFNLTLNLPATALAKGKQVLQYVQLKNLFAPEDPGIGMSCRVTVDNATDVTISSFEGPGSLLHKDNKDKTVSKQRTVDKKPAGEENFGFNIFARNDKDYETKTEYNGYKTVNCVADLKLIKENNDIEKVYNDWSVTVGARIYSSKTVTTFKEVPEFETVFSLSADTEEEEWFDPALLAAFDDVFDEDDEDFDFDFDIDVKEIIKKPLPEKKVEKDIASGKYTGKANMGMKALYNNIPKIDRDDQIEFIFEADIPKAALAPGKVIVQYAQLTGKTTSDIKIGLQCKVQVGNPDGVETYAFNDGALKATADTEWFLVNIDNIDYDTITNPVKSRSFYKLQGSNSKDLSVKTKNKTQRCKLILDVEKAQSLLFQEYDMVLGLIVYEDEWSTEHVQMVEEASTITLKQPAFKMKPVAKSTYDKVEVGEQKMKNEKNAAEPADKTALSLAPEDTVEQEIDIDYKPVKEQDIPDLMQLTFKTSGPKKMVKDGDGIFQYFQFRLKGSSDPYTTVGCYTEVGDADGSKSEVIAWEDAAKFDSATKQDKSLALMKSETAPVTRADQDTKKLFRKSFEATDYVEKVTADVSALSCTAVWDQPHKYGAKFDALFDKDYEVETGVRLFNDAADATKSTKVVEKAFDFKLEKPVYKFGDAYDFSDEPISLDAWSKGSDFDLSEIIPGSTGKGFLKLAGGFRVAPNFNSFSYQLQFAADLPATSMPDGEIFQFFVTKTDDGDASGDSKETFGCQVEVGNPLNAEVREFTKDFDASETGVAAADFNAASR